MVFRKEATEEVNEKIASGNKKKEQLKKNQNVKSVKSGNFFLGVSQAEVIRTLKISNVELSAKTEKKSHSTRLI